MLLSGIEFNKSIHLGIEFNNYGEEILKLQNATLEITIPNRGIVMRDICQVSIFKVEVQL